MIPDVDRAALRRHLRATRFALAPPRRKRLAELATRHLLRWPRLRRARCVAVHLAVGSEMPTAMLVTALRRRAVRVLAPRVDSHRRGRMDFVDWPRHTRLRLDRYGIPTPCRIRRVEARRIDLLVLPLLGFDGHGHRLGSGGGYYDRWLARRRGRPYRLGWAFPLQRLPRLACEPWDVRLHAVCTAAGVHPFLYPTTG